MSVLLSELTTIGLGGPADRFVRADTPAELIALLEAESGPVLLLGGGSNLVISDDGFPGLVLQPGFAAACFDGGLVHVQAGHGWDELVRLSVERDLSGIEALSGIPGHAGAAPMQNIGAYGQELAETLVSVEVYDRASRTVIELSNSECGFGYRSSIFKQTDRYVILGMTLKLDEGGMGRPVRYGELARRLGVEAGGTAPVSAVRDAVLQLRRSKGMVLDPADADTRSAGSFFMNPVVTPDVAAALPEGAPRFPAPGGLVKLSAGWLIENAGFPKGWSGGRELVSLSTKHTLALTNRGGASTASLLELAREVRDGVQATFGVQLVPEPRLVGVSL